MGGIGVVALLVNMSAALVLSRFRDEGDAAARAMWLFSRNDALANVAVIVAAGLVAVTGEPRPHLPVAGLIPPLLLHSLYDLLRAPRSEERRVGQECVSSGRSRWSPAP